MNFINFQPSQQPKFMYWSLHVVQVVGKSSDESDFEDVSWDRRHMYALCVFLPVGASALTAPRQIASSVEILPTPSRTPY